MAKEGWICPKCGRALAPWVSECPCYLTKTQDYSSMTVNLGKATYFCSQKARCCEYANNRGNCEITACMYESLE